MAVAQALWVDHTAVPLHNITIFTGHKHEIVAPILERVVTMLLGEGVEFELLPGERREVGKYVIYPIRLPDDVKLRAKVKAVSASITDVVKA